MRWDDFRRSDNVEDSRGEDGGFGGGGGIGIPVGGGGLGIGTIVVLGLIGGRSASIRHSSSGGAEMVNSGRHSQQPTQPSQPLAGRRAERQVGRLSWPAVLGNTEDTWTEIFKSGGQQYRAPQSRPTQERSRVAADSHRSAMALLLSERPRASITIPLSSVTRRFDSAAAAARLANCGSRRDFARGRPSWQNLLGILPKAQEAQTRGRQPRGSELHPGAGRTAG